ncbi:MAG: alpha/beta hydrolase [Anaerolineaceae bacterium]|nr:MAG: alpha/beta hydrolase [Anaerolineaceae bacterium]
MLEMLLVWLGGGLWFLSSMVLHPKKLSCDRIYRMEAKSGKFNEAAYKSTKKRRFMISSDYGYYLSCEILEPEEPIDSRQCTRYGTWYQKQTPIAILCHGFSQGKYRSLMYAEIFLKLGFKVLIYDHRNHGLSGKAFTSMGYYEKFDLKRLVDWCYDTYGPNCSIVTHGVSMGAATVLLHLEIDKRVICTIADCAYSDLKELLKHQVKHYYHMPILLIPLESFITYLRAGFWYGEVSPIRVISKVDTPVLFIHGKRDKYVPTEMSRQMYNCKKHKKAIYLVAKAAHAQSCITNRKSYEERVSSFLKKYFGTINHIS